MFLWNLQNSESLMSSWALPYNESYTYADLIWVVSTINMKFGQILVCFITSISNMLLAQCWRLETSSRAFYDFVKTTIEWDLAFFIVDIYHFLLSFIHLFKKMKHCNIDIIVYWVIGAGCLIKKDLELSPSPPNCSKNSWKLLPLLISINWRSLGT